MTMKLDEVQLAPWLFRSIKVAVDTDPRPGQFQLIDALWNSSP